jgi:hypothetical protein
LCTIIHQGTHLHIAGPAAQYRPRHLRALLDRRSRRSALCCTCAPPPAPCTQRHQFARDYMRSNRIFNEHPLKGAPDLFTEQSEDDATPIERRRCAAWRVSSRACAGLQLIDRRSMATPIVSLCRASPHQPAAKHLGSAPEMHPAHSPEREHICSAHCLPFSAAAGRVPTVSPT